MNLSESEKKELIQQRLQEVIDTIEDVNLLIIRLLKETPTLRLTFTGIATS